MPASTRARRASAPPIEPHSHAWAPVAMSPTGVIRMSAGSSTYLVPPSRALWIPPGVDLPDDKPLRQLCEAAPDEPTRFLT